MMPPSITVTSSACAVVSTMVITMRACVATSAGPLAVPAPSPPKCAVFPLVDVVDDERMPGLQDVGRHTTAHHPEADEANRVISPRTCHGLLAFLDDLRTPPLHKRDRNLVPLDAKIGRESLTS